MEKYTTAMAWNTKFSYKMPSFPKVTCKFNTIPNKFPTLLPVDVQICRHTDATLKYVLWQGKIFLNKKTKLADMCCQILIYHKAVRIKVTSCCKRHRSTGNRPAQEWPTNLWQQCKADRVEKDNLLSRCFWNN